jgi:hypothetical protein
VKHWIAYERVDAGHEAYLIVMGETAEEAERQMRSVLVFAIPKASSAIQLRLHNIEVELPRELPDDDPRAQQITDPILDWCLHGFDEAT